ncbi:hypothetical protein F4818DRAFT_442784 [Hypoxylon cercidicola]|nr:hypothetical protein F4818DRAFT_442784 [Hypoxylon cercidicola]
MDSHNLSWAKGEVAFLKSAEELCDADRSTLARYVPEKALEHPVIILDQNTTSKEYVVTTVSAYSSGPWNSFQPPWDQPCHKNKTRAAFLAFAGSEKPSKTQKHLELQQGCWPKPQASWVYSGSFHVVPASALREFRRRSRLRMTQDSFRQLLDAMTKNSNFASRWTPPRTGRRKCENSCILDFLSMFLGMFLAILHTIDLAIDLAARLAIPRPQKELARPRLKGARARPLSLLSTEPARPHLRFAEHPKAPQSD